MFLYFFLIFMYIHVHCDIQNTFLITYVRVLPKTNTQNLTTPWVKVVRMF